MQLRHGRKAAPPISPQRAPACSDRSSRGDPARQTVSWSLLYLIVGRVFQFPVLLGRGDRAKAAEIVVLFQFFTEAADTFVGNRDLNLIRTINPQLQPLEDWLIKHRDQLRSAL